MIYFGTVIGRWDTGYDYIQRYSGRGAKPLSKALVFSHEFNLGKGNQASDNGNARLCST